jgi:predicted transcriptional regulator
MAQQSKDNGRPLNLHLPSDTIEKLDRLRDGIARSRSAVVTRLVERAAQEAAEREAAEATL